LNGNTSPLSLLLDINFDSTSDFDCFANAMSGREICNWRVNKNIDRSSVKYAVVWKPDLGLLASLPNLEVIFSAGAGVDHIFEDTKLPKNIPIVRFVDPDLRDRMSEWVVLQCLMHLRQQRSYDRNQRQHSWQELAQPIASEVRVGVMGLGELGKDAALKLKMMGFRVSGWSRSKKNIKNIPTFAGDNDFNEFLCQSDIIVNLLPLTNKTTGILGRDLIEKLPQNGAIKPVIINAGRGGSQIEADIIKALQKGILGGVSLDVFEQEPLSESSALWDIENAILTPHVAAVSSMPALASYVAQRIEIFEANGSLTNLVDTKSGY